MNKADSQLLTRVGPSTPTGNLMREYWIPAVLSSELTVDGSPVRLMLLGEKLIAFRDSAGRCAIMDHRCPHRCASLFFGRNEQNGIRCVYHGWKYDAEGNCVDQANLPPHEQFKDKVKAKAYKTCEQNGVVWTYMGAAKVPPPMPLLEAALLPQSETRIVMAMRECNWLQAIDGEIDTSHFSFLHMGGVRPEDVPSDHLGRHNVLNRTPQFHVTDTEWGTMYGAQRPAGENIYWRVAHYLFPFWTMVPNGAFSEHIVARAWVPMDDTHTMFVHMSWTRNRAGLQQRADGTPIPDLQMMFDFLPNTTDWYGRWRLAANASNDYMIDRDKQATQSFTGIPGIHLQDQAITESMGPIVDHSWETLAPSDLMIARTRQRIARAVRKFAKDGKPPPGANDPTLYLRARSGDFFAPKDKEWRAAYEDELRGSVNPTGKLQAAE
jgi:phenylpropionate dioxygenase-like ring-hydroxylating dioxygenase large terminal subunit